MARETFALAVLVDGVEEGVSELIDGNDIASSKTVLETLDNAFELKEGRPDAVVSVVVCFHEDDIDRATGALQVGLGY